MQHRSKDNLMAVSFVVLIAAFLVIAPAILFPPEVIAWAS